MPVSRIVVSLILFLAAAASLTAGPVFRDGRPLYTLETEHFTFIFPKESQPAAEILFDQAEGLYAEMAAKLRVPTNLHIPVVLTPDTDELNGYFSPIPSIRIVLYQAPISPNSGFALFRDTLRKLFLHELVHAVSLMQTDGFGSFLVALFGDAVHPAMYWTPSNFIEGVTVSFESADGFGRANDAAYASIIQQSIIEDRWPTFTETTSAWSGYPFGIFYIYGGWFSRYLQETYGMDRYAELFHSFAKSEGMDDFLWFPGAFRKAFGRDLNQTWEDFRLWMLPKQAVRADLRPLDDGPGYVTATALQGNSVYWSDYRGLWVNRGGKAQLLTDNGRYANRLAVSPDGATVLVSHYETDGSLSKAVLSEFEAATGQRTRREFPDHLVEAAYTPEGLVACRVRGYTMDLVSLENGVETVLLAGSERLVPAAPTRMDDGRIGFLLQIDGLQRLAFVDKITLAVSTVEGAGLEGIRQISSDGSRVWFVWDNERTFLKLGRLEGDSITTYPATLGGAQFPVSNGGPVYAVSAQARGHRVVQLPQMPGESSKISYRVLGEDELGRLSAFERPVVHEAQPYQPWLWALVPQVRYPTLTWNPHATALDLFRGAGLATYSSDPTESVALSTNASWLWTSSFAEWDLGVTMTSGPVDVQVGGYDHLVGHPSQLQDVRQTGASVSFSDTLYGVADSLAWRLDAGGLLAAAGQANASPSRFSASEFAVPLGALAVYQNLHQVNFEGEHYGFAAQVAWNGVKGTGLAEGDLSVVLPFWRTTASVSSVAVTNGALALGTSGPAPSDGSLWLGDYQYQVSPIYGDRGDLLAPWIVQADLNFGFSLPIRRDLPGGSYAHSLDWQAGYQGLWIAQEYLDNLYLRVVLNFRSGAVPTLLSLPLAVGVRVDRALQGSEASSGMQVSLDVGSAFY